METTYFSHEKNKYVREMLYRAHRRIIWRKHTRAIEETPDGHNITIIRIQRVKITWRASGINRDIDNPYSNIKVFT